MFKKQWRRISWWISFLNISSLNQPLLESPSANRSAGIHEGSVAFFWHRPCEVQGYLKGLRVGEIRHWFFRLMSDNLIVMEGEHQSRRGGGGGGAQWIQSIQVNVIDQDLGIIGRGEKRTWNRSKVKGKGLWLAIAFAWRIRDWQGNMIKARGTEIEEAEGMISVRNTRLFAASHFHYLVTLKRRMSPPAAIWWQAIRRKW